MLHIDPITVETHDLFLAREVATLVQAKPATATTEGVISLDGKHSTAAYIRESVTLQLTYPQLKGGYVRNLRISWYGLWCFELMLSVAAGGFAECVDGLEPCKDVAVHGDMGRPVIWPLLELCRMLGCACCSARLQQAAVS